MEEDELLHLIGLSRTAGVGSVTAQALLSSLGSAKEVFSLGLGDLAVVPSLNRSVAKAILEKNGLKEAERILSVCQKKRIDITTFRSEGFPALLLEIPDVPLVLYYRGSLDRFCLPTVAIVGTRNATAYGKQAVSTIIGALSSHNINIVSGLAAGIDTCAHQTAIDQKVCTWAVMATGMDRVYPVQNKALAAAILQLGGILTEFPPGTKPEMFNFPARNRLIAGLCIATVVIESAEKGGSLITARLANDYNREVFALPGRITDEQSRGCNRLIAQGEAQLLNNPNQIADALGLKSSGRHSKDLTVKKRPVPAVNDPKEKALLDLLIKHRQLHIDQIAHYSGMDSGNVAFNLLNLEFAGIVVGLPGKNFALSEEFSS